MLKELIEAIDAHLAWRAARGCPMAPSTFGAKAVDDGKLVTRLREGKDITVSKMEAIKAFIARDREEVEVASQDAAA